MIHLFQRETKLNGEFGRLKPLSIGQEDVARFTKPEDREMLRLLLASDEDRDDGYDAYRRPLCYWLPRLRAEDLAGVAGRRGLRAPAAEALRHGALRVDAGQPQQVPEEDGRPLAWDDGPPWRFRLRIEADDKKKRWLLEGQLVREGQSGPVPLKTPALLLASGLVLLEDRLARLAAGDFFPWIAALRKASAIEVPYKDRWDLLGRLWQLPSLPETSLPPNLALRGSAPAAAGPAGDPFARALRPQPALRRRRVPVRRQGGPGRRPSRGHGRRRQGAGPGPRPRQGARVARLPGRARRAGRRCLGARRKHDAVDPATAVRRTGRRAGPGRLDRRGRGAASSASPASGD